MAYFPLYIDLKDKLCIIVGGGEVASRKVEILLRFDAKIIVVAPSVSNCLKGYINQGRIKIIYEEYDEEFIENAVLVVAATSSTVVNTAVYRDACLRNIPVNTVDDPEKCTFIFPSVVRRGDLVIGISTSGKYPALSKKVRKTIENSFNEDYSNILDKLAEFRLEVRSKIHNQSLREKILKEVIDEFYNGEAIDSLTLENVLKRYKDIYLTGGTNNG